jgi:stage II sporulation protein D
MILGRAVLCWWLAPLVAAPREVVVRLYWLHPPSEARVVTSDGKTHLLRAAPAHFTGALSLEAPGSTRLALRGPLEVKPQRGHLLLTLRLPLEEYVAAVLAGESSVFNSEEALKAMAVAARTYAVHHLGRHRSEGFDFCDTTHCQDLRLAALTDRFRAAAEATEGELLWYQGSPAATYYHQHCGGTTEAAHNVWPDIRAPYLRQQADTFCLSTGRGEWRSEVRKDDLRRALAIAGPISVEVIRRSSSGRVLELRVGGKRLSSASLEHALGSEVLRSNRYEVIDSGDRLIFQGSGVGHGVGLCQVGAAQRGAQGHTYRQILDFYYPGTVLGVSAQGFSWVRAAGERVELASTRPREDQFVAALADRLLADAESRAGFALGFRPRVKVYPTVATFRDATGEPGWVAASTVGRTVRLQPPPLLRSAGTLESTLRHEMLHLLVESRAHPTLPPWFREGLVLCLAEPDKPAGRTGIQEPRGQGEMRQAYQEAHSRVRALVDRHGRATVIEWLKRGLP